MQPETDRVIPSTVGAVLRAAYARAADYHSAQIDALLSHVIHAASRASLLAHPERSLSEEQAAQFEHLLARLLDGEPLAYLTGQREFHGLSFAVTPDVLIPRPETEELVDGILDWLHARHIPAPRIVDVGTGCGAIAITLAMSIPDASLTAVDVSRRALVVARRNARAHAVQGRVACVQSDLLAALRGPFDVIAANLPYIPAAVLPGLEVFHWEPALALDGGPDGLDLIRRLLGQAPARLAPGCLLALEFGIDQGQAVRDLCQATFPGAALALHRDLAGLHRWIAVHSP